LYFMLMIMSIKYKNPKINLSKMANRYHVQGHTLRNRT